MQVPKFEDEVNRKAMNTLVLILERHGDGTYTDEVAKECCHTVFNMLAGLVSSEVIELIEESVAMFEDNMFGGLNDNGRPAFNGPSGEEVDE